jgi:hypothetical protein
MKYKSTKIALSALIVLSLGTVEAGTLRKITRGTAKKTGSLVVRQVRGVVKGAAKVTDSVVYPLACLLIGSYVYDNHLKKHVPFETPQPVVDVENAIPGGWGPWTHNTLVRLVVGCLTVAGGHAVVNTNLVGDFVDENMPRLSRLIEHTCSENGLKKRNKQPKRTAL